MKLRTVALGLVLLAGAAFAGYLTYGRFFAGNAECQICGRALHSARVSTVVLANGTGIQACCPRCALHYRHNHNPSDVSRVVVSDYDTGRSIEATAAFYVEGSEVPACHAPSEPAPREPGVQYEVAFDRCQPGLIAFARQQSALEFMSAHGGHILSYNEALASVARR
jgi:hypothetical protein